MFDNPNSPNSSANLQLANLGTNRNGLKIQALVIDTLFLCGEDLAAFNVKTRTHHKQRIAHILFADGHVVSRKNDAGRFNVDARNYAELRQSFEKILKVFEEADAVP